MSIMNSISTENTPQQEFNFDEFFPIENNETSEFNFIKEKPKPNPNYINICKKSLKLKKEKKGENYNDSILRRTMSYSDLKINMKKEEEFNLELTLNKENITKDRIFAYLVGEMKEKIFIEEDFKNNEEEIFYNDEEEEEDDDELITAIIMYNNRKMSNDFRKILRERLKKRIKEDEKI